MVFIGVNEDHDRFALLLCLFRVCICITLLFPECPEFFFPLKGIPFFFFCSCRPGPPLVIFTGKLFVPHCHCYFLSRGKFPRIWLNGNATGTLTCIRQFFFFLFFRSFEHSYLRFFFLLFRSSLSPALTPPRNTKKKMSGFLTDPETRKILRAAVPVTIGLASLAYLAVKLTSKPSDGFTADKVTTCNVMSKNHSIFPLRRHSYFLPPPLFPLLCPK